MLYNAETRTLTLDEKACLCRDGIEAGPIRCIVCHGTGQGKRGGRNGCKTCHGFGRIYSREYNPVTCKRCNGTAKLREDWTDRISQEAVEALCENVVVYRTDRRNNWNENYLGMGSIYTSQDYGRAWEGTDEAIKRSVVKDLQWIQACKVMEASWGYANSRDSVRLAKGLLIEVRRDGYSVNPLFENGGLT